jgi:iron-sulfur cluster repair protein YtfE (RIC family)
MSTLMVEGREVVRSFVEHEHAELVAGIAGIHEAAHQPPTTSPGEMVVQVSGVLRWLDETLRPHMSWEEAWLFPQIDERTRTHWATRIARFDHHQIAEQAEHLSDDRARLVHAPSAAAILDARGTLAALEALLRSTLLREETLLLPILDQPAAVWSAEWRD